MLKLSSEEYKIIMRGIRLGKTWGEILTDLAITLKG